MVRGRRGVNRWGGHSNFHVCDNNANLIQTRGHNRIMRIIVRIPILSEFYIS